MVLGVALTLVVPWASAQVPPAGQAAVDSEALIRQASDLRRERRFAEALEVLHRASALTPGPRPTALTGLIQQALGRFGEASDNLADALAVADDPWVRRTRPSLESALADVRRHVGDLNVTGGVPGATVVVDDVARGMLPLTRAIPVTAGMVSLEVRARGYVTVRRPVMVTAGLMASERVTLVRPAPVHDDLVAVPTVLCAHGMELRGGLCYARPGSLSDGRVTAFRWMGILGVGVTIAAGATAAGLGVSGNSTLTGYVGTCGGASAPPSCAGMYSQVSSQLSSRATLVDALWVVAGVGAVASVVGFVLSVTLNHPTDEAAAGGPHLAALPGGVGVTW